MDMSFANQALSDRNYLLKNYKDAEAASYVSEHLDREIARIKLESMRQKLDK